MPAPSAAPLANVDRLTLYHSRAARLDPPEPGGGVAGGGAASQSQDPPRPDLLFGTPAGPLLCSRLLGADGTPRALPGADRGIRGGRHPPPAALRPPGHVGGRGPPLPRRRRGRAPSHAPIGPAPALLGCGGGGPAGAGLPHPLLVAGRGLRARTRASTLSPARSATGSSPRPSRARSPRSRTQPCAALAGSRSCPLGQALALRLLYRRYRDGVCRPGCQWAGPVACIWAVTAGRDGCETDLAKNCISSASLLSS